MSAILNFGLLLLVTFLDYFHERLFKDKGPGRKVKNTAMTAIVVVGAALTWHQYSETRQAERDTDFLKAQLKLANSALEKETKLSGDMFAELTKLRKQSSDDAVAIVDSIIDASMLPPAAKSFQKGQFALFTGRETIAKQRYVDTLLADPNFSTAHNNLGLIYRARGDTNLAEEEYRLALKSNPNNGPAAMNLASMLFTRGEVAESARLLSNPKISIESNPNGALSAAVILGLAKQTNSYQYLDYYVRRKEGVKILDLLPPLFMNWALISAEEKSSMTNWVPYFSENERVAFKQVLSQVGTNPVQVIFQ